jgi:hypothetical protein
LFSLGTFLNHKSNPTILDTVFHRSDFLSNKEKMDWATFLGDFSQTHLVTLVGMRRGEWGVSAIKE